ncbi:MAG: threonine--tRNA ligase [Armatimonadetes bacterium]|nr:threonine--tRNA ligase [Armatimonadota bacterium]
MSAINVTLPDGSVIECERGTTVLQVAEKIGSRLAKAAVAGKIDGKLVDLSTPVEQDAAIQIVTFDSEEGRDVFWHSSAHVLADAVLRLFPDAKLTIGPPIDEGFYYDFDVPAPFSEDDLRRIEGEMQHIVDADEAFSRREVTADEARELFADNPYKLEMIEDIAANGSVITVYEHNGFRDLCVGPHLPSTGRVKAFKLTSVAGAYWRGDEHNAMLQRIYGTAYPDRKLLDEHLERIEEAKRRDHRRIGRELDLFSFHEEAGAGLPYYHPKGAMLRQIVVDFSIREHLKRGYQLLRTPHLIKSDIWTTSGHRQQGYPMYFTEIDNQEYGIKPMNCPGHILIYRTQTRSYRDLPIRYFELGTVYRHELSGVLHGLMRVRGFTQDDAHIFCREDQLLDEITGVINFAAFMMRTFGFPEYKVYLSTRPEKSVGTDEQWEIATNALINALDANNLEYEVDPGGGAFYGPKIDIKVKDAIGRLWQCPTIQCDFTQPERFDITYVGEDGKEHRPVMIHRVVLAGIERFLGVLIENYAGAFPLWLAPVQVSVLPITDRNNEYAQQVAGRLIDEGFRVEVDTLSGTLGNKIRHAQGQKVPYMFVVGDKEAEAGAVAVRSREEGDLGPQPLEDAIRRLRTENVPGGA